jgi:hypothetical protein
MDRVYFDLVISSLKKLERKNIIEVKYGISHELFFKGIPQDCIPIDFNYLISNYPMNEIDYSGALVICITDIWEDNHYQNPFNANQHVIAMNVDHCYFAYDLSISPYKIISSWGDCEYSNIFELLDKEFWPLGNDRLLKGSNS